MFTEKTEVELASMTEGEVASYFKSFTEAKNQALKSAIEAGVKNEITTLKNEINAINDKRTEVITKALEAQGVAISKLSMTGDTKVASTLASKSQELKNLQSRRGEDVVIQKSMTIATAYPTYTQGYVNPNVVVLATRRPFIQSLLNSRVLAATGSVIYTQQTSRTGDAGVTAEGATKNNMDLLFTEVRELAKKVTVMTKVSKELIADIPFMESFLDSELMSRVALAVDAQLLTGSGVGDNLEGIFTAATSFSAGSFALSVPDANRYDVLSVAIGQVMANNFTPNYILLNPADMIAMSITKTATGEYVMPGFVTPDGKEVHSTPIIFNNGIPVGEYLVMDSTKSDVYTRESINITLGYDGNDFSKNMVTVIAEWRGLNVLPSNHAGAFVKGVFATNIAAILLP